MKEHLLLNEFVHLRSDHCVFVKVIDRQKVFVAVYVDDMLLFAKTKEIIMVIKDLLRNKFTVDDRGEVDFILGMKVERDRASRRIKIHHQRYIQELLVQFNLDRSKSASGVPIPPGFKFHSREVETETRLELTTTGAFWGA